MSVTAFDFTGMKWNLYGIPKTIPITQEFPELKEIFQEWLDEAKHGLGYLTKDQVIRYIIFTYHKQSPLIKKVVDIMMRKKAALQLAGVEQLDHEEVVEMVGNENRYVTEAIITFLKFERDIDYMALTMQIEAYYSWNKAIMEDTNKTTDLKNRTVVFKTIKELKTNIDDLSESVFRGDTTLANHMAVSQVLEARKLITPEQYAAKSKVP